MLDTLLFLVADGVTNGAVYGLLALSLIVIYTVTRVVNIAQGEYVTLGALSFASCAVGYVQRAERHRGRWPGRVRAEGRR